MGNLENGKNDEDAAKIGRSPQLRAAPSAGRTGRAGLDWLTLGARGVFVIGGAAAVFALLINSSDRTETETPGVKEPTFITVPTVTAPPVRPAAPRPAPGAASIKVAPRLAATFDYVQTFTPLRHTPTRICRDLASLGFAEARWAASEIFPGEWECSSPLAAGGKADERAFVILRGGSAGEVGSLMLKLNPVSPEDQALLGDTAKAVLQAVGVLARPALYDSLARWKTAAVPSSSGFARVLSEYGRDDRRIITLSVPRFLPKPPDDPRLARAGR